MKIEELAYDSDDDAPPPLDTLADQVSAVNLNGKPLPSEERVATVTAVHGAAPLPAAPAPAPAPKPSAAASASSGSGGLKKGFFSSKKPAPKTASQPSTTATKPKKDDDEIPFIRAAGGAGSSGASAARGASRSDGIHIKSGGTAKQIPEFLRVEPDAAFMQSEEAKKKILEAMKPNEQTIGKITKDANLIKGFDDPEVMAAVQEVAADPSAFAKYKNNPKVIAFYQGMAKVVGERLTEIGDQPGQQGQAGQRGPGQLGPGGARR